MKVDVYKLFKDSPISLHVGLRRMDRTSTEIHSDTLFSALSNSLIRLFGEDRFENFEKKLVVSSIFVGIRTPGRDILFLPMPDFMIKLPGNEGEQYKKYKKIQWISKMALDKLLKFLNKEDFSIYLKELDFFKFLNDKFIVSKEEFEEIREEVYFMDTILEPKVNVDRETNGSNNLYFQENLVLYEVKTSQGILIKPFLYFLKYRDIELDKIFVPTLNLFIEEGVGGERSTGKGNFDYYERDELEIPTEGSFEITLSLTIPKREEVDNLVYYQLVKRDGFIFYHEPKGFKKKTHYKVKEGALVKSPYEGQNIDVSPREDMRVISYGKNLGYKFS
ncbi:MAG: type III-A CRISPR-associated RAMP protein Csm4 [Dictyoglomus sp. NZ13-RE01]|nr:MAG: type III-A CRISPR-associated RAMP protein Csm4 [Dictyoglomus sp. NZ13-RE01]